MTVVEISGNTGAKTLTTVVAMGAVSMVTAVVKVMLPSELIFISAAKHPQATIRCAGTSARTA